MPYADYSWYKEVYKGTELREDEFSSLALKASKYLDKITFGRIDDADDNVKLAMCAVAEEMLKVGIASHIASETNDGYSISYKNTGERESLYKTAGLFLPPELLYRGVEV